MACRHEMHGRLRAHSPQLPNVLSVCSCGVCVKNMRPHLDLADDLECDLSWHLVEAGSVLVPVHVNTTMGVNPTACVSAHIGMHTRNHVPHHAPLGGPYANKQPAPR